MTILRAHTKADNLVSDLAALKVRNLPHGNATDPTQIPQRISLTVAAIATPGIKHHVVVPPVELPKSPNWAVLLCDHLEKKVVESWAVTSNYDTRESREENLSYLLAENLAPVSEMAPTPDLSISRTNPACLNGELLRHGPTPKFKPLGGYHRFDGDGMIHGLHIKDGKATYVVRYVQTSRLLQEEALRSTQVHQVDKLRKILGVLDDLYGEGTGNTALAFHNSKLLALHERDRPYNVKVLEDGDLQTISIEDYGQKLHHPFTAHPKIDPITVYCQGRCSFSHTCWGLFHA